ncbi:GNAT family N-acetyltransferase [Mesobacillus zeae]|uniref:GNAT family N-acetyltransferase n=1 Tax=Mesobacillus zeae TaxID=1917180 RepID=UPI001FE4E5D9|nr:GNAT family N-acetyltransferase [Mesobacillus zeae]
MKLNWDMLQESKEQEVKSFFYYHDGMLAGFLGVYWIGNKVELTGMVHPLYRRHKIFTNLFSSAMAEINQYENKNKMILLNAPSASLSAKGFLKTVPNEYIMTEYQMKWNGERMPENGLDVKLRPAMQEDLELVIKLDINCFGYDQLSAREINQSISHEKMTQQYIIEYSGESAGKIRVSQVDGESWIFGFAVLPEYQGKGIGRQALSKVIERESKKELPIFLEVEAKNSRALGLYESCGFKTFQGQDYFDYKGIG